MRKVQPLLHFYSVSVGVNFFMELHQMVIVALTFLQEIRPPHTLKKRQKISFWLRVWLWVPSVSTAYWHVLYVVHDGGLGFCQWHLENLVCSPQDVLCSVHLSIFFGCCPTFVEPSPLSHLLLFMKDASDQSWATMEGVSYVLMGCLTVFKDLFITFVQDFLILYCYWPSTAQIFQTSSAMCTFNVESP